MSGEHVNSLQRDHNYSWSKSQEFNSRGHHFESSWVTKSWFRYHFGIILGSSWGRFGVVLGSSWGRLGVVLESFWGHLGIILGASWGHFGVTFGTCLAFSWGLVFLSNSNSSRLTPGTAMNSYSLTRARAGKPPSGGSGGRRPLGGFRAAKPPNRGLGVTMLLGSQDVVT